MDSVPIAMRKNIKNEGNPVSWYLQSPIWAMMLRKSSMRGLQPASSINPLEKYNNRKPITHLTPLNSWCIKNTKVGEVKLIVNMNLSLHEEIYQLSSEGTYYRAMTPS
jgi:hypothetical protein